MFWTCHICRDRFLSRNRERHLLSPQHTLGMVRKVRVAQGYTVISGQRYRLVTDAGVPHYMDWVRVEWHTGKAYTDSTRFAGDLVRGMWAPVWARTVLNYTKIGFAKSQRIQLLRRVREDPELINAIRVAHRMSYQALHDILLDLSHA